MEGGSQLVMTLALVGAGLALLAAAACVAMTAWFVRRERSGHHGAGTRDARGQVARRAHEPVPPAVVMQVMPPPIYVQQAPPMHASAMQAPAATPGVQLQRAWPGVADALGQHLRVERDPIDRMRVAIDLGGLGGARPASLLLDAVREGSISPAAGAEAIRRTGFAGGVIAGAAMAEADPRVRSLARLVLDGAHGEQQRP